MSILSLADSRTLSPAKKLTLIPLIGVTYCMVAGGPYGLEELVHASGYRNAIIILMLTPILWSFPVTLMVSELSSALPQDGGYYVWVKRALGPFWGFQEAWLSFASSIFDMAIYPTLFLLYLSRIWPSAQQGHRSMLIGLAIIAICVAINLSGIKIVGFGSVAMSMMLLAPFGLIILLAGPHPLSAPAAPTEIGKTSLLAGILVAMWNYMGWDNASTIAGEVVRPQRTYPLAMFLSVALVALTYIIPIAAVSRSGIPAGSWGDGSWVTVGQVVGKAAVGPAFGNILGLAVMFGGMISALSMFNALILSYSRVPTAMADDGLLPRVMAIKSKRTDVPWVSILVCAAGWALCLKLGFMRLLILDTILYGLSLLLEFAALIALRLREPNLSRPYRVPGGLLGCILISLGPVPLVVIAFVQGLGSEDKAGSEVRITGSLIALGLVLYIIILAAKRFAGRTVPRSLEATIVDAEDF
jgi:amino acid transporter